MPKAIDQNSVDQGQGGSIAGVMIGAVLVVILFFFNHYGRSEMGLSAAISTGDVIVAIGLRWQLRRRPWFWPVMALIAAAHVPAIVMFRWPDKWIPGIALLPIGLADILLILSALWLAQLIITRSTAAHQEP